VNVLSHVSILILQFSLKSAVVYWCINLFAMIVFAVQNVCGKRAECSSVFDEHSMSLWLSGWKNVSYGVFAEAEAFLACQTLEKYRVQRAKGR
jgi:hypothetical protein